MDSPKKKMKITLGTFDLIKGIAMMIIIMSHALAKYKMRNAVMTAFPLNILLGLLSNGTMPMFFILAGYSFKARPVDKMLKKSIKELMKPYFIVMVVIAVIYPACHFMLDGGDKTIKSAIRYICAFLLGLPKPGKILFNFRMEEAMVVWFLLAMFIAINLLNCIFQIKNEHIRVFLTVGITVIGYILASIDFTYFCIPQGMVGLGFCYAGYLIKKYNLFGRGNSVVWLLIGAVSVLQIIFDNFNLAYSIYSHGYLSCIGAVCSGMILAYIGLIIRDATFPFSGMIRQIGMYSYWIMCIHSVELTCLPWHAFARSMSLPEGIVFTIEILLKAILILVCCGALKKLTKYKYKRKLANGK